MKKLTFYLFGSEAHEFEDLLKTKKLGAEGFHELTLSEKANNAGFEFKLFVEENKSKPPKWVSFIQDYTTSPLDDLKNVVNSFVVLVKVPYSEGVRYFAITGGFGFNALNKDMLEQNFGLRTTLNSVDPKKLRFMDAKNIDVRTKQKRVMSNVSTEVFDFGINFDEEVVRIVSGYCSDPVIGRKMSGADSLSLSQEIEFQELGEKCKQLLDKYMEETYKKRFDFIDNIQPIKDKTLIDLLDQKLVQALNACDFDSGKIAIAYPDQIEYERCNFYKVYGLGRKNYETEEIDVFSVKEILGCLSLIDLKTIKNRVKIVGFEEEGKPVVGSESLYGFLVFETEIDGEVYVFSNKMWFKVSLDYIEKVNQRIKKIVNTVEEFLPAWSKSKGKYLEGQYNDSFSSEQNFVVMDKKLFHIPQSRSKVEVADLFQKSEKRLICVKKLSASSTLSHLFAQGSVSVDLLKSMDEYKTNYDKTLKSKWPDADINIEGIKLTYAVGTGKTGDILDIIPFFSKVNLLHHSEFVRKFGVPVEITRINLV
jgi:uncharacterized protein (TIGR04141 family)